MNKQQNSLYLNLKLYTLEIGYQFHFPNSPLYSQPVSHKLAILNDNVLVSRIQGQFYAISFYRKKGAPKIEKNVIIYQNTLSRNYWCQKIVKGGWLSWIFWDPLNSSKIGCLTKSAPRGPIFKERYKCYTFSESSCQPLIGAEERKVWRGQENWCQGLQDEKSWTL